MQLVTLYFCVVSTGKNKIMQNVTVLLGYGHCFIWFVGSYVAKVFLQLLTRCTILSGFVCRYCKVKQVTR